MLSQKSTCCCSNLSNLKKIQALLSVYDALMLSSDIRLRKEVQISQIELLSLRLRNLPDKPLIYFAQPGKSIYSDSKKPFIAISPSSLWGKDMWENRICWNKPWHENRFRKTSSLTWIIPGAISSRDGGFLFRRIINLWFSFSWIPMVQIHIHILPWTLSRI